MDTEKVLNELLGERQIRHAMARYSRGVDRRDEELLKSIYHDDAFDDHGWGLQATGEQFAALVRRDGKGFPDEWKLTMHFLGQHLIDVEGDEATSEVYFISYNVLEHDGQEWGQTSAGRYVDQWERRDGGEFKIVRRQVIYDWWRTDVNDTPWPGPDHDVPKMFHGGAALDTSTNVYGTPGPEDKSYQLLTLLRHGAGAAASSSNGR
jgi:hypothetical protein